MNHFVYRAIDLSKASTKGIAFMAFFLLVFSSCVMTPNEPGSLIPPRELSFDFETDAQHCMLSPLSRPKTNKV